MTIWVVAVTTLVVTMKVALVVPAATVTLSGTVAAASLLDRVIVTSFSGTAFRMMVACAVLPLRMFSGSRAIAESVIGGELLLVNDFVAEPPRLLLTVMLDGWGEILNCPL